MVCFKVHNGDHIRRWRAKPPCINCQEKHLVTDGFALKNADRGFAPWILGGEGELILRWSLQVAGCSSIFLCFVHVSGGREEKLGWEGICQRILESKQNKVSSPLSFAFP